MIPKSWLYLLMTYLNPKNPIVGNLERPQKSSCYYCQQNLALSKHHEAPESSHSCDAWKCRNSSHKHLNVFKWKYLQRSGNWTSSWHGCKQYVWRWHQNISCILNRDFILVFPYVLWLWAWSHSWKIREEKCQSHCYWWPWCKCSRRTIVDLSECKSSILDECDFKSSNLVEYEPF